MKKLFVLVGFICALCAGEVSAAGTAVAKKAGALPLPLPPPPVASKPVVPAIPEKPAAIKHGKTEAIATGMPALVVVDAARIRGIKDRGEIVGYLAKGDAVTVTGPLVSGWYPIKDQKGREGRVIGWSLKSAPGDVKPVEVAKPATPAAPVIDGEALAVRITSLRVEVIGLKRSLDEIQSDIKEIKTSVNSLGAKKI